MKPDVSAASAHVDAAGLRARFAAAPAVAVLSSASTLVPAAVLVPVIPREAGLSVLLTRRTEHLHHHPGQISFPGGRAEPGDAGPEATALRESREEIGLPGERVELLGRLPLYCTITGFAVTPVVGLVHPPFEIVPDRFEVAEVFELPLDFVLDRRHLERHQREYRGQQRSFYAIPYQGHFIWGATAGMLVSLANFLSAPQGR